jgi:hypothetical protein
MRSRRFIVVLYGCLAVSVACQRERVGQGPATPNVASTQPQDLSKANVEAVLAAAPAPVERVLLGSTVGPDGSVTVSQRVFRAGDPIRLTLWLKESPKGLQTSAHWFDEKEHQIAKQAKAMEGAKVATFTLDKKLKPGKYHVTCFWGGNDACAFEFEVTSAMTSAKRKKS